MRKKLFSFFFLFASLAFTAELPYPIIFVHGINNNAQMWEETELIQVYFDIYSMTYQQIDITLDYNINYNSPHDPYEDDVHMFTVVEPNGYYLINFDVDYSGTRIGLEKNNKLNLQDYINDSETTFEIQVPGSGDDMYGRLSNYLRIGDVIRIGNEYMKTEEFISWDGVFDQVTISVLRGLYDSSIESHGITQDIYVVSNQSNQSSIMKQGYGLLQAINAVKVANNAEKVILVGHSMGGLAARMYVQYFYQEDVAKLVTIGTPNLGAVKNDVYGDDIIDWTSYFFETGIDEKSEAVRDLAYHYNSELSINPTAPGIQSESDNGVFLFGGDENSIPDNLFINKDVNADGDENDNDIVGLNNMVFPNDFEYYFFTGKTRDETMRIDADNDGVVLTDRQWLDLGSGEYTGGPLVWYRTDPPIEAWHSAALVEWLGDFEIFAEGYEVQETIEIIKSLDEPDEPTIAWGVETDKFYRGIATHQSTTMLDYDWYKFDLMGDGYVSLYYYPPYGVSGRIDFYTDIPVNPNENSEYNYIYVENNQSFNYQPDILLNSNTYYFRVRNTVENTDAWSDNYSFEISAHFVNVYSSFTATPTSGYAPLTVQFTDLSYAENTEITTWEWHFGDGQTSFEQNPEHTYTNSGTYTVTLMVGDGTYYATEAEPNYITIYTEDPPQSDTDITAVEYFFDDDPGVGGGISIPISQGNVVNIQTNISISSLSVGLHRLYVRARDEDGIWGIAQGKPVLVQSTGPDDPLPNITDVEYFFDDDPGVGGGTDLSLSPSTEVDISSNISISSLSVGLHRLYVRARDEDGIWGIAQGKPVLVQSTGPDDPLPNIVDIEYFFNSDPGFGNAESFEFTPSDTVNIDSNLSLAELDLGEHLLYVRAMDETGIWGIAQYHEFTVEELEPPIITEIPNLFFNEDESTQISLNNYVTDEDTDINDLFWSTYFPNDLEFSSTVFQNDMLKIDNFKKTVKPTKLEISNLNKLFNSLKKNKFVQPKLNEMKVTQNRDISDSVFILINSETQIATISAYENFNQLNIPVVFRVTDQYGLFDEDTSTISIYPVNDAPSIEDLNIELDEDTTVEIEFIGSDIEGDELSYIIYEEPIHGNVVGNIYTPNQDYYGSDSLFYIANDGELDSEPATVTITVNTVNDTPIADDISVTTDEDVSVAITMTGSDADGDDLTFSVVSAPVNGTYDGTTYTPNTGWFGVDSFTYVANDGELDSEIATVTINVILITVTLNKDLSVGWNWFSINIENDDMSLDNVFYSLGENATL
ncbi:MAG: alpha/beta fold hydrolase, partial [Candidatus Marinimicrobia bacterium]|nr:alpha/beta fold hydrolase [Candidatus Neomarinimicrobiota bacterium]